MSWRFSEQDDVGPERLAAAYAAFAIVLHPAVAVAEVLVVPAQPEGFQRAYIDQNAWWAVRIAAKHRPNLKWIAAYQVNPIGAVTHIAEIDRIEPFGDEGKFKILFKGPATKLEKPIPYGNAPSGAMQGPRYCTKAGLDAAKTVADLVR